MSLKPIRDYILVKPIERKLSNVIQVVHSEPYTKGEVVEIGDGKLLDNGNKRPVDVNIGDIVWYCPHANHRIYKRDGVEYRVIQEADIGFVEYESEAA